MMKRIICAVLCICLILTGVPAVVQAEDGFADVKVRVLFGAAKFEMPAKLDGEGRFYAPISWIRDFGPNMVETDYSDDPAVGVKMYYLEEQEKFDNFAKRIFIDTNTGDFTVAFAANLKLQSDFAMNASDFGTWATRAAFYALPEQGKRAELDGYFSQKNTKIKRAYGDHIVLYSGTFSGIFEDDGEYWAPMDELLPLMEVNAGVSSDGKYLCMQPVQDTFLRFLYRRDGQIKSLLFNSDQITGKDFMVTTGWIIDTATGNFENLNFINSGGLVNSYEDLFKDYLMDSEAYLKAFSGDEDPTMKYIRDVTENGKNINEFFEFVFESFEPLYKLIISKETAEMQKHYLSFFKPGKSASTAVSVAVNINEYLDVYVNHIEDHMNMLDAVYGYSADPEWPSVRAAKNIENMYRSGFDGKIEVIKEAAEEIFWDKVSEKALSKLGPWYYAIELSKFFCAKEYEYIADSADIDQVHNSAQYPYQVFQERIHRMKLNADDLNDARLCLMMSMIASRHAYKTYWEGYKQDEVDKIDEILAELYTSGRWSSNDSKDCRKRLQPVYYEELKNLWHIGATPLVDYLTDPQALINMLDGHEVQVYTDHEEHCGTLHGVFLEFDMTPDHNGNMYISDIKIHVDGCSYPFAYDIYTMSHTEDFMSGMQNMISWADQSILPQDQSYFGWQSFDYDRVYEIHGRWYAGNGMTYYIILSADPNEPDGTVHTIQLTETYLVG